MRPLNVWFYDTIRFKAYFICNLFFFLKQRLLILSSILRLTYKIKLHLCSFQTGSNIISGAFLAICRIFWVHSPLQSTQILLLWSKEIDRHMSSLVSLLSNTRKEVRLIAKGRTAGRAFFVKGALKSLASFQLFTHLFSTLQRRHKAPKPNKMVTQKRQKLWMKTIIK